jgi:hypothetical protein
VANAAFELDIGETSPILVDEAATEEEPDRYYIVSVSGREVRPLSDSVIQQEKDQNLATWLEGLKGANVESFDLWQSNVPGQPVLDRRFLVQPTEAAPQPTIPLPEPTVIEEGSEEQ